jgi:large subunit ribosomal protein L22
MESRAYLRYARISPRKVQIVLDLIRINRSATRAAVAESQPPKRPSEPLAKLLKSAVANGENNLA